jgi:hybrid cluster-associated redox disulfide protein
MAEETTITKDMIINDVIKKHPKTITVFSNYKVDSCCGGGSSIEKTASMNGVDVDSLLEALNKVVEESSK